MPSKNDLKLIDIARLNPRIVLDIRYATENNFTGKKVYTSPKCYLRKGVALKLDQVQKTLEKQGLGLKVYDGYRPLSVQKIFWEICPNPLYVADPAIGSRHNRGAAVDVTLVDDKGNELEMPTEFDDFTVKAHHNYTNLPKEVLKNRKLLEESMMQYQFIPYENEWWHYDDCEWTQYPIEDISIEAL